MDVVEYVRVLQMVAHAFYLVDVVNSLVFASKFMAY
jgi:hypothetical protein